MAECSLLGWLTLIVLAGTGGVIAWYTIETWRLRREAQRQTELSLRPFLSLIFVGDGLDRRAHLVNVGQGLARNITLRDTAADSWELRGQALTHLRKGGEAPIPYRVWMRVFEQEPLAELPAEDHGWNVAELLERTGAITVVTYASITGRWYETTIDVVNGTPRIVSDRPSDEPPKGIAKGGG